MAGSYRHIADHDNNFRGVDLIDNLGDAHEALEECYDMIKYLTGGDKRKVYVAYCQGHLRTRFPDIEMFRTEDQYWASDD